MRHLFTSSLDGPTEGVGGQARWIWIRFYHSKNGIGRLVGKGKNKTREIEREVRTRLDNCRVWLTLSQHKTEEKKKKRKKRMWVGNFLFLFLFLFCPLPFWSGRCALHSTRDIWLKNGCPCSFLLPIIDGRTDGRAEERILLGFRVMPTGIIARFRSFPRSLSLSLSLSHCRFSSLYRDERETEIRTPKHTTQMHPAALIPPNHGGKLWARLGDCLLSLIGSNWWNEWMSLFSSIIYEVRDAE